METPEAEYYGSQTQQRLQQRAENLWELLKHDRRFSCHGRAVGLAEYTGDNLPTQLALARVQGVCPMEGLDQTAADLRKSELAAAGLVTDEYVSWEGEAATFDAARSILRDRSLPDDLTVLEVGARTLGEDVRKLAALTQQCDVLLPMGSFLRGQQNPSVFLYAKDTEGNVVGASGAVAQFHADHPKGNQVWWGMLATDHGRRGEGIAILLGAMALQRINETFGYTACFTGIRAGNHPSEALCSKLALSASDRIVLIAIDPEMFGDGQVTK